MGRRLDSTWVAPLMDRYHLARLPVTCVTSSFQVSSITSITDPLAMSTPQNNERSPNKWLKQKFRSVFSSSRSPSRNLEMQSTSTNVPPINSPSDSEGHTRIKVDRTESGKKIGLIHKYKRLNTLCSKNYPSLT